MGCAVGLLVALLGRHSPAIAEPPDSLTLPALVESLDGPSPVLRPLLQGSGFTLGQRVVTREFFRYGTGAETIQVHGPAGRSAQIVFELSPAPVIQELRFGADVATNRTGLQLAARVVLPRTSNKATGRPYELLLRGGTIAVGGSWEQLTLDALPEKLAKQARVARVQYGAALDERGAYVSQLVFLAPGGTGLTELIVDRIRVFGVLNHEPKLVAPNYSQEKEVNPNHAQRRKTRPVGTDASALRTVRIPRIIQWQGESFELLQKMGFNTIGMSRLPTEQERRQAAQLGLALFCPPPTLEQLSKKGITAEWDSVLAWNLGEQLSTDDLDHIEHLQQQVARTDTKDTRPTVLAPQLHTLEASRMTDVLLLGRAAVGTNQTVREYSAWLAQRQRLARPGTPVWSIIETQASRSQRRQTTALGGTLGSLKRTSYAQLLALTSASFGIKPSGFYFQSDASLVAQNDATRQRALELELSNLRLQLAEPWLIAGKEISGARATHPELSALVLQSERSELLVPVWWSLEFDAVTHPRIAGQVSLIVPGVSESSEAFLVTLAGMRRVPHKRVTGGVRVTLEELPLDSFILLSDDPQAIAQVTRYLRRIAPRAAQIRRELANTRLQQATQLTAIMGSRDGEPSELQRILAQARGELAECDRARGAKNFLLAYLQADAVDLSINGLENQLRSEVGPSGSSPEAFLGYSGLSQPERQKLLSTLARAPVSENMLVGGGFENLPQMLENGWRHKQLPLEGITTAVRLSPESPHSGSYCLELKARSLDESSPTAIVPTAPVWITSAPLQVQAGDLVEITGLVRITEPLLGSVDGLQIIDTLGGADMAVRMHEAPTWRPFRIIRSATADAQVSVTIALSGLGEAQIDDLAVRRIQHGTVR